MVAEGRGWAEGRSGGERGGGGDLQFDTLSKQSIVTCPCDKAKP